MISAEIKSLSRKHFPFYFLRRKKKINEKKKERRKNEKYVRKTSFRTIEWFHSISFETFLNLKKETKSFSSTDQKSFEARFNKIVRFFIPVVRTFKRRSFSTGIFNNPLAPCMLQKRIASRNILPSLHTSIYSRETVTAQDASRKFLFFLFLLLLLFSCYFFFSFFLSLKMERSFRSCCIHQVCMYVAYKQSAIVAEIFK